jgi:hypothetical protein
MLFRTFINSVNNIELCNQFVYLGLLFNYNGIFTVTQKTLSEQGKKATFE